MNRLNVDLILALKPAKCDNKFDEECEEDENTLHVTKDQGKSWEKILDNVYSVPIFSSIIIINMYIRFINIMIIFLGLLG